MNDNRVPILYLAPWVDFGGSDKGTIDWFRWLDRTRFRPSLITTQPSENRRLAEIVPYAEEIWELPELMSGSHFAEFILDFIASREVALLHVMNSRIGFDLLPDIHALQRRPQIVVQLHVEEPTRDGYVRYVTTRYGTLVDAFSVSSQHLAAIVADYGVSADRIEVIHTGVDAQSEFSPDRVSPKSLEPGAVNILCPGRVTAQKDPLLMVEVARELVRRGLDYRLHVVGSGELDQSVRARVDAYGLQERVLFHPPTHELAGWYRAADVLLMTSVFEGVPYVVYEALAMGTPVVAPALPGNIELMDGVGGTLVAPRDDVRGYADALEPLLHDRSLRERVGAEGRARVLERFSLREMGDRHGALYERIREAFEPMDRGLYTSPKDRIFFVSRPSRGTPLVSIVTPCFNHGRWLRDCVASVKAQTYPELEMIVCDDGSTERETLDYLDELEAEPAIRLVRMAQNAGPAAARNRAIAESSGRYVLPVDADNLLLPDAVERLVAHLQGAGGHVGYVYQNLQFFGNREDYFEAPVFNAWQLTRGNYIDTCALIDREVFERGFRYPREMRFGHEDWDFVLTLAEHGIIGEPMRAKTLRYRKHGFSRSDRIDWAHPGFHADLTPAHPTLTGTAFQARGDNPGVRLKARWSPSLTLVALAQMTSKSPAWADVLAGARNQRFRDFEIHAAIDRDHRGDTTDPRVRSLAPRLAQDPAAALAHVLEISGARNVVATTGTGLPLVGDPGSLERITRLIEDPEAGMRAFCFADAGPGHHPFALLDGRDPALVAHSAAWSRRHKALQEGPASFDRHDPIGGIGRWLQVLRVPVQWRHLPGGYVPESYVDEGRFVALAPARVPRAEDSDRRIRLHASPVLPGLSRAIPRLKALPTWIPPAATPLIRHRRLDRDEWLVNHNLEPPAGFFTEQWLGVAHLHSLQGTLRLVEDSAGGYVAVPQGGEPDADEMAHTLGYVDNVALPLFDPLFVARHAASGASLLLAGSDDPIRGAVDPSSMSVLGWIDRMPVNPRSVPARGEGTAWLRGLIRTIDTDARRHRVSIEPPGTDCDGAWELGALLDRDPGGGIPAWVDGRGRFHTRDYSPTRYPFDLKQSLRWAADPVTWHGFGQAKPRARALARRSLQAIRFTVSRPGLASAPAPAEQAHAWLLAEEGPDRISIFSAIHPVTADQLVTRDPSEAHDLGYGSVRLIGYALAIAAATGSFARPRMAVRWASRFGESLTRSADPIAQDLPG